LWVFGIKKIYRQSTTGPSSIKKKSLLFSQQGLEQNKKNEPFFSQKVALAKSNTARRISGMWVKKNYFQQ